MTRAVTPVDDARIRRLDEGRGVPDGATHVLYWMQRAVRAEHNDALEHAIAIANHLDLPVRVVFGLTGEYPEATSRHLRFHVEGLAEVASTLRERGIPFAVRHGHPPDVAVGAADGAAVVVVDRAYLRHLRQWREQLLDQVVCPVVEVEADVVVPVELASEKHEHAARTLRPKVLRHRDGLLRPLDPVEPLHTGAPMDGLDTSDVDAVLRAIGVADDGHTPATLRGGTSEARRHLDAFVRDGLAGYGDRKPDPLGPGVSHQAPYLHFGHVSPVEVGLRIQAADAPDDDVAAFLEQLVVRRELAINHVHFAPDTYDRWDSVPEWAQRTLAEHRDDPREHVYTRDELVHSRTHDDAWNACQTQVREDGYLHNHLRMYWGKQVLKWMEDPQEAFETLLWINNHYLLDGRDCASYASVLWIFGLHDRGWQETPVAGTTRPMTRSGLDRKLGRTGMQEYLDHVAAGHDDATLF